jgi:hypothetical protein
LLAQIPVHTTAQEQRSSQQTVQQVATGRHRTRVRPSGAGPFPRGGPGPFKLLTAAGARDGNDGKIVLQEASVQTCARGLDRLPRPKP